jgi:hypothetical protein
MKKTFIKTSILSLIFLPIFASAATLLNTVGQDTSTITTSDFTTTSYSSSRCNIPKDIGSLFEYALCILSGYVVPFLIGLGLVLFLVGVVNYVRAGDNEEKRAAGRDLMWFGIVALFVMIGVWGFVNILFRSFFGQDTQFASLPKKADSVFQQ